MDTEEYRRAAAQMVDYIARYYDTIRDKRALADVKPGYLRPLLPEEAPEKPDKFDDILRDVDKFIMPGMTHWLSPQFHAYYAGASSFPSMLADMLCTAMTCVGFTWRSSPACTELEVIMMDWLGELLGLPSAFLTKSGLGGGGVIQSTASEATLTAIIAAKKRAVDHLVKNGGEEYQSLAKLVAYTSDQSHSSVEKAALITNVKLRSLPTDDSHALRGDTLAAAIEEDKAKGLVPCCVIATLGTTPSCAFDNLVEIGKVCQADPLIWLHVDAAYAGAAFVCEEFRGPMAGLEYAESFNFNPHKWLLVNFDCSAMWVKTPKDLVKAFNVDPIYLRHEYQGNSAAPDFRHWHIPLGRRFRSLKLWFVMRLYGRQGLQKHIRDQVSLAHQFEDLVRRDDRFEIVAPVVLGLVCFRLKPMDANDANAINEDLVRLLNDAGAIHLVPSSTKGVLYLRLAICSPFSQPSDMEFAWNEILKQTEEVMKKAKNGHYLKKK